MNGAGSVRYLGKSIGCVLAELSFFF
uniref:Uncharacterized protein n=1 Tax=Arundo donax TaxID=35708 RepID=A0A0A9AAG8_ARUDO